MEFHASTTEKEQRGLSQAPWLRARQAEGEDSFIQGQPRSETARAGLPGSAQGWEGISSGSLPKCSLLGTCPAHLFLGGAKERLSGAGSRGSPLAQEAWKEESSRSCLGRPWPPERRK